MDNEPVCPLEADIYSTICPKHGGPIADCPMESVDVPTSAILKILRRQEEPRDLVVTWPEGDRSTPEGFSKP